ncbi:hypothetical protein [Methylobacter sp. S3L5C]|uniref:hypothetical protein n=1 Tax=Methylobacter sp. S3L5C TaxID=2839024 RepID=UPI001FAB6D1D|nr:hypothetical protein [Methylobacter sp. S3L5C]UOA10460.1 hypothetical protein KKZ03_09635 [Methylobacter sp. S3L5C]
MADSQYSCSIRQGFNFEKDAQVLVGHLVTMKIGTQALGADIKVTNPTNFGVDNNLDVVGIISDIFWKGGYADPLQISFNVSNENAKLANIMKHTDLTDTTVVFQFAIYDFDPIAKKYYLAFYSDTTDMNGLIFKQGGDLALDIGSQPDSNVASPLNFQMYTGIMPQESAQVIKFAVSDTDKFVKTWGVAVST